MTIIDKSPFPFVAIMWTDSQHSTGWTRDEVEKHTLICISVGWLTHDGDMVKTITQNITCEPKPQRCGEMSIPTKSILKIERFTENENS